MYAQSHGSMELRHYAVDCQAHTTIMISQLFNKRTTTGHEMERNIHRKCEHYIGSRNYSKNIGMSNVSQPRNIIII